MGRMLGRRQAGTLTYLGPDTEVLVMTSHASVDMCTLYHALEQPAPA